jgi:hypothetical protein
MTTPNPQRFSLVAGLVPYCINVEITCFVYELDLDSVRSLYGSGLGIRIQEDKMTYKKQMFRNFMFLSGLRAFPVA